MKKASVYFKVMAVAVILTGLVQIAAAQPWYGRNFNNRGFEKQEFCPRNDNCLRLIPDLTDKQQKQIDSLRVIHMKEIQPLKSEININKAKIDALILEDNPDVKEILRLIEENGKLKTEIQKKNVLHKLEIRKQLTDEQKVLFGQGTGPMPMRMHDRDRMRGNF